MQTYDHRRGGVSFTTYPSQPFNFWGQTTKPLEWLVDMPESEQDLIDEYKGGSKMTLWVVRIIGFVVMLCAFKCIFEPLSVATELLQYLNYCTCCLGSVLEKASQAVINVVSCSFACSCFCVVFGLAWLAARPTYAVVSLGVVAIGLGTVLLLHMGGKKAASRELKIPLVSAKGGPPEQHFKCVTLP